MKLFLATVLLIFGLQGECLGILQFSLTSPTGRLARLDILNSLKIASSLANPNRTEEESTAIRVFVNFITNQQSTEYLEVFYTPHPTEGRRGYLQANPFKSFLMGVLYNGNPDLPMFPAAEIIVKMLKSKVDLKKLEELRKKTKVEDSKTCLAHRTKTIFAKSSLKRIYNRPQLFCIKYILDDMQMVRLSNIKF